MKKLRARNYATPFSGTLLAVAFAFLCMGAYTFETWIPSLEVKEGEVAPVTVRLPARYFRITMLRNEFHYLSTTSSTCPHLVPRGTKLKPGSECTGLAKAFESSRRNMSPLRLLGTFVFYLVVGLLLVTVMRLKSMERARSLRAQGVVFSLFVVLIIGAKAILLLTSLPAVILPVVTVPLLGASFFKKQFSFILAFVAALVAASLVNFDIEMFLVFLISGMTALAYQSNHRRAWVHLKGGAFAGWVAVCFTLVTTLIFSGTLDVHDDLTEHLDPRYSLWISALFGGLGSGILAWLLTPFVGLLVGEVSRSKLLDLQDLDQRLLGRLRERAPGTWEHSRAMANLAEAAANAIGANALLARTGAHYHDIGKSDGPEFFIENQGGGPNPHDELDPEESTSHIFWHVVKGTRMLRQEGLPEDVVEFCYSHHGTSVLEFFWHKTMAAGNPDDLEEKDFVYPGHKPSTRETGILMVVDAIEAGARTVDTPDKTTFQNLVQRIVFSKLSQGQLDETGLSLADLRIVVNTLVDTLVNMYHVRIKYPWQSGDTGNITPVTTQDRVDATPTAVENKETTPSSNDPITDDSQPTQNSQPAPAPQTEPTPSAPAPQTEPTPSAPAPQTGQTQPAAPPQTGQTQPATASQTEPTPSAPAPQTGQTQPATASQTEPEIPIPAVQPAPVVPVAPPKTDPGIPAVAVNPPPEPAEEAATSQVTPQAPAKRDPTPTTETPIVKIEPAEDSPVARKRAGSRQPRNTVPFELESKAAESKTDKKTS